MVYNVGAGEGGFKLALFRVELDSLKTQLTFLIALESPVRVGINVLSRSK